jgi:hypothetical protein
MLRCVDLNRLAPASVRESNCLRDQEISRFSMTKTCVITDLGTDGSPAVAPPIRVERYIERWRDHLHLSSLLVRRFASLF